jgi:hypothetical protein
MRKIKDEGDAKACLAAVRAAGGDVGEWARANGVDGRSLTAWRNNLVRRGAGEGEPEPPKLVEIVPAPSARPQASSDARYVLDVGHARLEFGDACSAATLRRVLEVLQSC